jgi:hypothetical protein
MEYRPFREVLLKDIQLPQLLMFSTIITFLCLSH